jgi:hypothetical protein
MYSHIDDEGHSFQLLKEIIDHDSNGKAVSLDDGFMEEPDGTWNPLVWNLWPCAIQLS